VDGSEEPEPDLVSTQPPNPGLPLAVDAGGGPPGPDQRSGWMWLVPMAFLALLIASLRQLVVDGRED